MKGFEFSFQIPPFGGHRFEFRNLRGIDGCLGGLHVVSEIVWCRGGQCP